MIKEIEPNIGKAISKGAVSMKQNWWETDNAHGILIVLVSILECCLIWFKSDLWIYFSAIYVYVGTWIYHFTVKHKNCDVEHLNYKIKQLERYSIRLEEELEKEKNKFQQI